MCAFGVRSTRDREEGISHGWVSDSAEAGERFKSMAITRARVSGFFVPDLRVSFNTALSFVEVLDAGPITYDQTSSPPARPCVRRAHYDVNTDIKIELVFGARFRETFKCSKS